VFYESTRRRWVRESKNILSKAWQVPRAHFFSWRIFD
jgi:hypothetical protein